MKQFKKTSIALSLAQIAIFSSGTAMAQSAAPAAPVANGDMERVMVTATRRDTLLQDTPLAISAYTQDTLANNQVKDLASLTTLVPSLVVEQHGDSGGVHVYLRGVGSANHTELGDPAVAFYVDGIYLPRPQGATALMYDLNHVEVARGPQGTLNGRNSTAGAVSLVSSAPSTSKVFGAGSVTLGDYNHVQTQAMINLPIGETMALRLAAIKDTHDGYVDFRPGSAVLPGTQKYGAGNQSGARASLLWNLTPELKVNLIADYFRDTGAGNIALSAEPQAGQNLRSALIDTPGTMDQSIMAYKAKVQYKPTESTQLQYLGSWSRYKRQNANDADAGQLPGFKAENRTEWSQFDSNSNEFQFRSDDDKPTQWILGAFLFNENNKIRFDIDRSEISSSTLAQDIASGGVIYVQPTVGQYASSMSFIQPDRELHSKAVFAQLSQDVTDKIKLTAGLRYTKDDKSDVGGRNWACPDWPNPGVYGSPTASNQLVTPGGGLLNTHNIGAGGAAPNASTCGDKGPNDATLSYSKSTFLARGEYRLDKDSLLFASVTTGFHSPAMGDGGATTKPETLTSYELGYKADLANHLLSLNLDAFVMKYKDKLESQVVNNVLANFNAAGATVKGLESEFTVRPTSADRISGNATWLSAHYDSFVSCDTDAARANGQSCGSTAPNVDVGGSTMKHAPTFAATVQYEHDIALSGGKLTPRASLHYEGLSQVGSGAFNTDVPGHPGVKQQEAYSTLDLSLRFVPNNKAYTIEAFVNNATDKAVKYDVWDVCGDLACTAKQQLFIAFYNAPRTMGARISYKF